MRATITRKMIETTIHGFSVKVNDEGVPSVSALEPVKTYGKVSHAEAFKELKRANPDADNVTVGKIASEEVQFEITVEDFVKNAKRVEKNSDAEKEIKK